MMPDLLLPQSSKSRASIKHAERVIMTEDFLATLKSALASLTRTAVSKDKIHAYAHFMVLLAKLVKPTGELDPKLSEQLKTAMQAAGIKKSCARRYIDNSVGAFKANPSILAAAKSPEGAKAVLEMFDALGIKTQKAIYSI